jgi:hypothetical protein
MDPSRSERLAPFKRRIDEIVAKPITESFSFSQQPQTPGVENTDRWTWVDAPYMAPPAFGLLAKATGDDRYLNFMDREFKPVYDTLYDRQAKLFYRDDRFINMRTPNGEKVFWSRGNGWVFAGSPLLRIRCSRTIRREMAISVCSRTWLRRCSPRSSRTGSGIRA